MTSNPNQTPPDRENILTKLYTFLKEVLIALDFSPILAYPILLIVAILSITIFILVLFRDGDRLAGLMIITSLISLALGYGLYVNNESTNLPARPIAFVIVSVLLTLVAAVLTVRPYLEVPQVPAQFRIGITHPYVVGGIPQADADAFISEALSVLTQADALLTSFRLNHPANPTVDGEFLANRISIREEAQQLLEQRSDLDIIVYPIITEVDNRCFLRLNFVFQLSSFYNANELLILDDASSPTEPQSSLTGQNQPNTLPDDAIEGLNSPFPLTDCSMEYSSQSQNEIAARLTALVEVYLGADEYAKGSYSTALDLFTSALDPQNNANGYLLPGEHVVQTLIALADVRLAQRDLLSLQMRLTNQSTPCLWISATNRLTNALNRLRSVASLVPDYGRAYVGQMLVNLELVKWSFFDPQCNRLTTLSPQTDLYLANAQAAFDSAAQATPASDPRLAYWLEINHLQLLHLLYVLGTESAGAEFLALAETLEEPFSTNSDLKPQLAQLYLLRGNFETDPAVKRDWYEQALTAAEDLNTRMNIFQAIALTYCSDACNCTNAGKAAEAYGRALEVASLIPSNAERVARRNFFSHLQQNVTVNQNCSTPNAGGNQNAS